MTGNVKLNDKVWRELVQRVNELHDVSVQVGIVGQAASTPHGDEGPTNAEIGLVHEFGSPSAGIPERSWLRQTFRIKGDELARIQAKIAKMVIAGKTDPASAIGLLGAWAAGAVKATITRDGTFAPLAPETIARKGSSKPLVDTGQLVNSISWVLTP